MLTLTTQDGRSLSLDARRPVDAAEVGRFLEAALGGPVLAPDATPTTPVDGDRTT
ncbi:hypothetical protein I3F60_13070 [Streptomyces sp. MUM 136J]|nr:hypothetical protein [Streptomyces sp. MUM 2J]MCH0570168.1 hypothetical protein [Streptomyces sp. MUM 136J]